MNLEATYRRALAAYSAGRLGDALEGFASLLRHENVDREMVASYGYVRGILVERGRHVRRCLERMPPVRVPDEEDETE